MSIRKRIWSAAMNDYTNQDLNSSVLKRFLNVTNVSAERVSTSREFQTVGAATHNALDPNAMVATAGGGCCNSRADLKWSLYETVWA